MLTDEKIRQEAAMSSSYTKGCQYYREGSVGKLEFFPNINSFKGLVFGGQRYLVQIDFDDHYELVDYDCSCLAFSNYSGACKHIVAVMKTIQKQWYSYFGYDHLIKKLQGNKSVLSKTEAEKQRNPQVRLTPAAREMLDFFSYPVPDFEGTEADRQIRLVPTYHFSVIGGRKTHALEFAIGGERMYVLKNIPQFLEAFSSKEAIIYGKFFTFQPMAQVFDERSKKLVDLLQKAYIDEGSLGIWQYAYSNSSSAFADKRYFRLTNSQLVEYMERVKPGPFDMTINHKEIQAVQVLEGRPPVGFVIKAIDGGIQISMDLLEEAFYELDADCTYIYYRQTIYHVDEVFSRYIKPLLRCFNETRKWEVDIPELAVSDFFSRALPALEKVGAVEVQGELLERVYQEPLEKQVYFDRFGSGISVRIEFKYGDLTLNPADSTLPSGILGSKVLIRDTEAENRLLEVLRRYGFQKQKEVFVQPAEETAYEFLQEGLEEVRELAEVFYSDGFKQIGIKSAGKISAGVRLNSQNLLELSFQYEDISARELLELLASYRMKKKYHRLRDGAFIPIDSQEFTGAAELIEQLGLTSQDLEKKVIELPKYRAMYIDSLARENSDFHMERSSAFKKMVQDIREPQDMDFVLPEGIQGKLRDYQKVGFKWLKSLASYGLGGILADDMGLGKTLQVITFLLSEKAHDALPSLVVAPTSLVYNWQDEVKKFAPGLQVCIVSGQPEERLQQLKEAENSDLVVTSYALLKRDIELYKGKQFQYCFLDEAQHIKNPKTVTAKAVKKIKASGYFAMTGTPIENTLTELWSIFDFLLPGYLGTHKSFLNRFELPIVKNKDEKALTQLGRYIKPFILRRMKKTVLKELPEKIESRMLNEMTPEQAKLYDGWLLQVKKEFESEVAVHGFEKSQIKILSLLTRLRQICCHPALFFEHYHEGSGKLEMLMELLSEAISGNHRILLFSQFTGMLDLIKKELDREKITYFYLDGSTSAEERIKRVHAFNGGEKNVFLISLKAGGTGLNLTGADMVIHYDPWWNPAVEDQATDRAYRIGQKNSVQVYKLITKNTIEEKIYELQMKKKELIDGLIQPGETLLTKMSEEEIRRLFEL